MEATLSHFKLHGVPHALPGGTSTAFRVGDVVLKHIDAASLENNHSPTLAAWIADFCLTLPQEGFRIPKPLRTNHGNWITLDGWTASTFLAGRSATAKDIPKCIIAIQALHKALKDIPRHPLMENNNTPWGLADRWCWAAGPERIQPQLHDLVHRLYGLRKPLPALEKQLIHADLNPRNILVAPGLPPAFLDLSPFWGPPDFALAIFANFIGPRCGNIAALSHFEHIKNFDQLLIRAAIRMLLVMSVIDRLEAWRTCPEKKAAEMIIEYLSTPNMEGNNA